MMKNWLIAASAALATIVVVGLALAAPAMIADVQSAPAGAEYCYTSEDGDWLICRLKEG